MKNPDNQHKIENNELHCGSWESKNCIMPYRIAISQKTAESGPVYATSSKYGSFFKREVKQQMQKADTGILWFYQYIISAREMASQLSCQEYE